MSVTALFVELLVVGTGAVIWLALSLAAIVAYKFDAKLLSDNPALLAAITAGVYVLGIVVDRIVRELFIATVETKARAAVFTTETLKRIKHLAPHLDETNLPMGLEKLIRARSAPLAERLEYNRSRLRICRAWVLHLLLIAVSFSAWNYRLQVFEPGTYAGMLALDVLLLILTWRATVMLAVDHHKSLVEALEVIMSTPEQIRER
jgi:hypothetical protein